MAVRYIPLDAQTTYQVTIHCLPAEIGHNIILLVIIVLPLVTVMLVILVLVVLVPGCHHHQLCINWPLHRLLIQLLVTLAIIGDGNCLHYLRNLDID